jgi:hypothetical protein
LDDEASRCLGRRSHPKSRPTSGRHTRTLARAADLSPRRSSASEADGDAGIAVRDLAGEASSHGRSRRARVLAREPAFSLPATREGEPVLTVRQPWASAILRRRARKDVENRSWATDYRGRLRIHAGKATQRTAADEWAQEHGVLLPDEPLERGVIIGCVRLAEIIDDSDSVWASAGCWQWVLYEPMLLANPVRWRGRLGLTFIRPPQGRLRRP